MWLYESLDWILQYQPGQGQLNTGSCSSGLMSQGGAISAFNALHGQQSAFITPCGVERQRLWKKTWPQPCEAQTRVRQVSCLIVMIISLTPASASLNASPALGTDDVRAVCTGWCRAEQRHWQTQWAWMKHCVRLSLTPNGGLMIPSASLPDPNWWLSPSWPGMADECATLCHASTWTTMEHECVSVSGMEERKHWASPGAVALRQGYT